MVKIPKRNKSKDNPYILGFDKKNENYIVEFTDNKKSLHRVEISKKVYEAFDKFELEDVSQIHKFQRHIEHSEIYEENLLHKAINKPISVEEEVENRIITNELKSAIDCLSDIQRRRIKLYFFEDKTFEEIAKLENCTKRAVKFSVDIALQKLKEILKK